MRTFVLAPAPDDDEVCRPRLFHQERDRLPELGTPLDPPGRFGRVPEDLFRPDEFRKGLLSDLLDPVSGRHGGLAVSPRVVRAPGGSPDEACIEPSR